MLKTGEEVTCEISKLVYKVEKKLGEGGQGAVFLVKNDNTNDEKALKWYNSEQSTLEQKSSIIELIGKGAPKGNAGKRFVWPIDIVTSEVDTKCFGYLMEKIDMSKYAEMGEIWAKLKPEPCLFNKCKISYAIVDSYRQLHLDGYCYRDISSGNVVFNPETGDVLICDNDNVGINNQSDSQIKGTLEYMAPELILNKAKPSTNTDLYSLSVLLFQLWMKHHPLHGNMEYNVKCWDLPAKEKIYGKHPVFIFNPLNHENTLPPEYSTPKRAWEHCPQILKDLFIKAFTDGIQENPIRVTEGEWKSVFTEIMNNIANCPNDNAETIYMPDAKQEDLVCWYCKKLLPKFLHLILKTPKGNNSILLNLNTKIYRKSIDINCNDEVKGEEIIAEVIQNPKNPQVWGIRNLTDMDWTFIKGDGTEQKVSKGKSAPISTKNQIKFSENVVGSFK